MAITIKKKSDGIESLTDFIEMLSNARPESGNVTLYRGHYDVAYKLMPSLFRETQHRRVEKNILRELISIQPNEFREDKTVFEQLVRMQHYGLPTRLLDLTFNPLVGLYFTCVRNLEKEAIETDGEFITLTLPKSAIKYFDSDTVSCVANLSSLTGRERDIIRSFKNSNQLNKSEVGNRLLHFIKAEKSYFLPKIILSDLKSVFAVRPKQMNRRILAQQGAFLIFGLHSSLRIANDFKINVVRTKVRASAKKNLIEELDGININPSTLFPEIESAAKYIMSKIPTSKDRAEKPD